MWLSVESQSARATPGRLAIASIEVSFDVQSTLTLIAAVEYRQDSVQTFACLHNSSSAVELLAKDFR